MYDFSYTKPTSIPDALKTLGADPEAKAPRRRPDLHPVLKQRLAKPSAIVDLGALNLRGIHDGRRQDPHRRHVHPS